MNFVSSRLQSHLCLIFRVLFIFKCRVFFVSESHIIYTEVLLCHSVLYIWRDESLGGPAVWREGVCSPVVQTDSSLFSALSTLFHYLISLCAASSSSVFTPRFFGGVVRVALDSAPPLAPSVPREPSVSRQAAQNPALLPGMCTYHHTPGTGAVVPQYSTSVSSDSASISIISIIIFYYW